MFDSYLRVFVVNESVYESMLYEAVSSVAGPFFIIYSFKHVKDRINTLNLKIIELICLILTSEYLLLMNLFMRADFPTFESPIRTTLQSWRASDKR